MRTYNCPDTFSGKLSTWCVQFTQPLMAWLGLRWRRHQEVFHCVFVCVFSLDVSTFAWGILLFRYCCSQECDQEHYCVFPEFCSMFSLCLFHCQNMLAQTPSFSNIVAHIVSQNGHTRCPLTTKGKFSVETLNFQTCFTCERNFALENKSFLDIQFVCCCILLYFVELSLLHCC